MIPKAIVFVPDRNTGRKKDFTGAFLPEARSYARHHGISTNDIVRIDVSQSKRKMRKQVLDAIDSRCTETDGYALFNTVAFFCHGYSGGIQLGFARPHIDELAQVMAACSVEPLHVPLYCCSTANTRVKRATGGDGGFADLLRDSLCRYGCVDTKVMGHVTVGHTTRNPHVRMFNGNRSDVGGTGGMFVARPNGPLWKKWGRWLRKADNRFAFPHLERAEIVEAMVKG